MSVEDEVEDDDEAGVDVVDLSEDDVDLSEDDEADVVVDLLSERLSVR